MYTAAFVNHFAPNLKFLLQRRCSCPTCNKRQKLDLNYLRKVQVESKLCIPSTYHKYLKEAAPHSHVPYAHHYNPRFAYFFTLFFSAVYITDNLCTKNANSSFFKPKIRGLYTRAVTDQERVILARVRYMVSLHLMQGIPIIKSNSLQIL